MPEIGIDWFPTGPETKIKVVSMDGVELHKDKFEKLMGLTLVAKPEAQFYYEKIGNSKERQVEAIKGNHFFSFTVKDVVETLKKSGKDTKLWDELNPDILVQLISTSCEVLE